MTDKPTLAILGGTGNQGPSLSMRWARAGYKIIIGSRKKEKAQRVAAELNEKLGIDSIEGLQNDDAARAADISVLTVVQSAHQSALKGLKEALQGKVLIDTTARVEFRNLKPPEQPSAARLAQEILGNGVTVAAAFQNISASVLRKDLDQPIKADVLVCSDDLETAEQVITLAESGGMHALYAGGLDNAVVVEGLTALLISINKHYGGHSSIQVVGVNEQ